MDKSATPQVVTPIKTGVLKDIQMAATGCGQLTGRSPALRSANGGGAGGVGKVPNLTGGGDRKLSEFFEVKSVPAKQKSKTGSANSVASNQQKEPVEAAQCKHSTASCQTDISLDNLKCKADTREAVVNMLIQAEPTSIYWQSVAEERRIALQSALEENLKAYQEIAQLREQNRQLKQLAEEGQKFAELLQAAMAADSSGVGTEDESE